MREIQINLSLPYFCIHVKCIDNKQIHLFHKRYILTTISIIFLQENDYRSSVCGFGIRN